MGLLAYIQHVQKGCPGLACHDVSVLHWLKFDARVGAPACMMSIYVEIYILHVINNNGRIFDTAFQRIFVDTSVLSPFGHIRSLTSDTTYFLHRAVTYTDACLEAIQAN